MLDCMVTFAGVLYVCLLEDKQLFKSGGVDDSQLIHHLANNLSVICALKYVISELMC